MMIGAGVAVLVTAVECSLDDKEIKHEVARKRLDAMPKAEEVAVYWQEFNEKQK